MRFMLDADQEDLQQMARRFFETESPVAGVRRVMETPTGFDAAVWKQLGELGLLGLAVPEDRGGSGTSLVEAAIVLREAGRALLPAPLLAATICGLALVRCGDGDADLLPAIAGGTVIATLATSDADGSVDLDATGVTADEGRDGWTLDGAKGFVPYGAVADVLLVTASTAAGVALFAVAADAPGLVRTAQPALDPTRTLASVTFWETPARLVSGDRAALQETLHLAAVCLAAEQVGGAERCLETAVAYASTRIQFDRAIGSFQSIKHLLADVLVEVESARAAADYAAWAATASVTELPFVASLAKAFCSETYVQAAAANLQVHGGMGFTWEHDAHLHLKRAMVGKQLFGSPELHRERIASYRLDG